MGSVFNTDASVMKLFSSYMPDAENIFINSSPIVEVPDDIHRYLVFLRLLNQIVERLHG